MSFADDNKPDPPVRIVNPSRGADVPWGYDGIVGRLTGFLLAPARRSSLDACRSKYAELLRPNGTGRRIGVVRPSTHRADAAARHRTVVTDQIWQVSR
jgi:hypothetical protein